jgi:hypothetical protein
MLFRWSIWGESVRKDMEMLTDSVSSFQRIIGERARYVIYTDDRSRISSQLRALADVRLYAAHSSPRFSVFSGPTWAKWCPSARLAPGEVEVLVDADVFLLSEPTEVLSLEKDRTLNYLALGEFSGAPWQRGCFADQIPAWIPYINAGFFAQGPVVDISASLERQFEWWTLNYSRISPTFHDEQGALTASLLSDFQYGRVTVLPKDRYAVVSPRSNPTLSSIYGLTLIHATYPGHPAYHRFKADIRKSRG